MKITVLLNVILFGGCSSNKKLIPSINGYYRIKFYKSPCTNRTIIFGNIYEHQTDFPVHISAVKLNNYRPYKADLSGKYKFKVKPDKYTFTGVGMPYKWVETEPIIVKQGDSIRIDFYLKPDNTPLVD